MNVKMFLCWLLLGVSALTACSDKEEPNSGGNDVDNSKEWIAPSFAKALELKGYIEDENTVKPSDVANLMHVYVNGELITSLKGIEYFESVEILHCADNELTTVDLSKCLKLKQFFANNNRLKEIKPNTRIEELSFSDNQLTEIDLSKCSELKKVHCDGNLFKRIDVSKNSKLNYLSCACMYISNLDVSKNTQLSYLSCGDNLLTQLDISQNTKLTLFLCHENPGVDGLFRVKAWFDNDNVPKNIDNIGAWYYNGKEVKIYFYK
ncbi:MAG: hypothetical protein K2M94_04935 [Paramuribaculum sp.]|nr:hypothetical protein [Paramuribaculum sp.]